ncbi:MAG: sensor histidine kinase [Rhodobacteraceae bacterium]|nr:sensor histidine kinase [Paracoccaceae bacterium]
MKLHSLAARLVLLACLSLSVALGTISFVLSAQFSHYFEDRVYAELGAHLDQLTANLSFDDAGDLVVFPLPDPRFEAPFSGLYWQVHRDTHPQVVSRSLWTGSLDVPFLNNAGALMRSAFVSSMGEPLLALSRAVRIGSEAEPSLVHLSVAVNQTEVQRAAEGFQTTMLRWMAIIFIGLILAAWVQVKLGLAPLENLRKKVERVRGGKDMRLEGDFPAEVMPLADEVNELLDLHEKTVNQARERASDLAHGLKTPLTIINTIARDLRKNGQGDAAAEIDSQIASMTYFIERELARVRVGAPAGAATPALPVAERMLAAIKRFPREAPLEWQLHMAADFTTPFDAHDLSELLGNQLDNARKWAKSVVWLSGEVQPDGTHVLSVEDDGKGVDEQQRTKLGQRGQRLDPSAQGSGLGLAICADLAAHYGADFSLERSALGGLKISISWQPAV